VNQQAPQLYLNTYLDEHIDSLRNRNVSSRTLTAYRSDIIKFLDYFKEHGKCEFSNLQPQDIESYIRHLAHDGAKFSSIKRSLIVLKEFFDLLLDKGVILSNPTIGVKIGKVHHDILSLNEIISIFQYLHERQVSNNLTLFIRYKRDELILLFMLLYGLRQYQIPTLKLSAIQHTGDSLTLALNDHKSIKLSGNILIKLREYLTKRNSNNDVIFDEPSYSGPQFKDGTSQFSSKPITISSIQLLLKELNYALNLKCTPTSIYHTYIYFHNHPEEIRKLFSLLNQDRSFNPINRTYQPIMEFSGDSNA